MRDQGYHEVFIPSPDVYSEGGPEAITEFQRKGAEGRNLVILPLSYVDKIGELEERENSYGAAAALKYVKELKDTVRIRTANNMKVTMYRVFETSLDLCIVTDNEFSKLDFKIDNLERKIRKELSLENTPIKVVTGRSAESVKYSSRGLTVEEPKFLIVDEDIIHKGILFGNNDLYAKLQESGGELKVEEASFIMENQELYMNQFIRFNAAEGESDYAIVTGDLAKNKDGSRIVGIENMVVRMIPQSERSRKFHYGNREDSHHLVADNILGIKPFDMEQYLAMQYGLLNPEVSLFFLCGKQGSGKTVLTYAYAMDAVMTYEKELAVRRGLGTQKDVAFQQIVLMKAPEILGGKRRDVGALPGDLFLKLKNHLAPYKDAHGQTTLSREVRFEDLFLHPKFENEFGGPLKKEIQNKKMSNGGRLPAHNEAIELIYSGFAGGRSKSDTLFIVDEAQDYTPYEMKTIIERLALGSSMIILGDPKQTRNPNCTVKKNGLTYAVRNYLGKPYSGLVALSKNYRSQISEDSESMRVYNSQ
jgi:predicted ribonuclease YlaK